MQEIINIVITFKDMESAENIMEHLLDKKLIACANLWPAKSMYLWKGNIEKQEEIFGICKTSAGNYKKVSQEVKKLHGYEIPLIERIDIKEINKDYLDWLGSELK